MPAVYALRYEVFVVGQRVPVELERDEYDDVADHGLALAEGVVLGTGRLVAPPELGGAATVGRMAVAEPARGRGIGAAVLRLLEQRAVERGWGAIELHAQVHAVEFYRRNGYAPYGEVYLEAGIEHLSMSKQVS
jgi:predicted GNAT family N-acyltransferase